MSVLLFDKKEVGALFAKLVAADKITLVGDQGIYLMSFFEHAAKRTIVYERDCNPESGRDDWYDNKRAKYGGDDGGDDIGTVADIAPILSRCRKHLVIRLTATHIEIVPDLAVRKKGV